MAAGGTAGHVIPALSVAKQLTEQGHDVEFAGGDRAELTLVPAAGFAFHPVDAEGLSRTSKIRAAKSALKSIPAVWNGVKLLRKLRPDVVMGGGGYVAGIIGAAAVITRTPLVLTEADSHLGISNRALSSFAKKICLAFPISGHEGDRWVVTGRPVPAEADDRLLARDRFGVAPEAKCVLVTGGSLGATSINLAALEAFASSDFEVIHLAGERDLPRLSSPRDGYHLFGYVDEFADAVLASDLAVARAGGSVFELAAGGCPAILIPYPQAAGDHQTGNARWMESAGAAEVLLDRDLNPARLRESVERILGDEDLLVAMATASKALARPDAAAAVANEVVLAGGGA